MSILQTISEELSIRESQVQSAVTLLDEGSTVPFISRYRKEATGGLDDTQLRNLEERLRYLRDLNERRAVVLKSIGEQGKLSPELEALIRAADTKTRLEDLYLPYRPRRRTKGQIAREAGIEPLALALLENHAQDPDQAATSYVDEEKGFGDVATVLEGARSILVEKFAEDAELVGALRAHAWEQGKITSKVVSTKKEKAAKFSDYFDFKEPLSTIPSHRALAFLRGRNEGFLRLSLLLESEENKASDESFGIAEGKIASRFDISSNGQAADAWLLDTVRAAWRTKLYPHLEADVLVKTRESAEAEAIQVFARNLSDLLLAAPGGPRATMGLDPGIRTGVKVAIVDATGKLIDHTTVFPHAPRNRWAESIETLATLARKHNVELVSIGNGTASRETDKLVRDLLQENNDLKLEKLVVNEAGASVYSASELAAKEFPDLDVSFRGAASIARRLQDPLAELVKIEPKSIGVGQYQHDVNQAHLSRCLDAIIEDCVNAVGVDVNMASMPLLSRVSGLNKTLAQNIVTHRDENGRFKNRAELMAVARMGEKSFEQCAGFLRIVGGADPLDASAVHPEAYPLVRSIVETTGKNIQDLVGDATFLRSLSPESFTNETFGLPTVHDILRELEKPGRDPRPEFVTAEFKEGVETLDDLEASMILEGVVSNVTNFGAFVDIGVHQDGLVHISQLSHHYTSDPREIVKAGDVVKVKVLEIDKKRKRIGLSMLIGDPPPRSGQRSGGRSDGQKRGPRSGGRKAKDSAPGGRRTGGQPRGQRSGQPQSQPGGKGGGKGGVKRGGKAQKSAPKRDANTVFGKLLDAALAEAKKRKKS